MSEEPRTREDQAQWTDFLENLGLNDAGRNFFDLLNTATIGIDMTDSMQRRQLKIEKS